MFAFWITRYQDGNKTRLNLKCVFAQGYFIGCQKILNLKRI
ncbi:hypothetical protein CAMRE0001_1188 [Campylobacter rectus RM3267]|uniref:Uncharacterized protein n=1 Tax=Campylobacter rectus RM3267 TaxID=553218 RepID=B9D0I4_CAMRE|nr:hypothetical protein CAMRE0001_1188 [Campylobacter rectus RM3267]